MREQMPMTKPLISVVVPHLNQADHLRRCLSSLRDQSVDPDRFEVVVVDNGSESLPAELCAAFEGVRLEQETIPGPGPARNKGVSMSHGDILAFIDADCVADPEWLAAVSNALGSDGDSHVAGGDVRIALSDRRGMTPLEAYESIFAYRQREYIERQNFSGTGNLAMRRAVYDAVGPFAGKDIAEDRDWGRRATSMGYKIRYLPEMIVFHPARTSFNELYAKWDRHVSHDFEDHARRPLGRVRWVCLALAVAVSPPFEVRRIMTSGRVGHWKDRLQAARALVRIRLRRARKMLELAIRGKKAGSSESWNAG